MEFSVLDIHGKCPRDGLLLNEGERSRSWQSEKSNCDASPTVGLAPSNGVSEWEWPFKVFPSRVEVARSLFPASFFIGYGQSWDWPWVNGQPWKTNLGWSQFLQMRQPLKELMAKGCLLTALLVVGAAILQWDLSGRLPCPWHSPRRSSPEPNGPAVQMEGGSLRHCISEKYKYSWRIVTSSFKSSI